jgi:4-hydroxybenzoate polyprenyltransferase
MSVAAPRPLSLATLLTLGRVSNLPTVWTNVLAATVLAGGAAAGVTTALVMLAMSLAYVGGMYLNDYFDRAVDARERPQRPIPAGEIAAAMVAGIGFAMLAAAVAVLAALGPAAGLAGLLLALAIVIYDVFHKHNPLAPAIMGGCRALVYLGAAAAAGGAALPLLPALAMLAYVAGLTYAARQEVLDRIGNLWPLALLMAPVALAAPALVHGVAAALILLLLVGCIGLAVVLLARRPMPGAVPRAVGLLIAGISLVDAALMASIGATGPALMAVTGFAATLLLQRHVPGT